MKIAYLFPGQGSQSIGMNKWAENFTAPELNLFLKADQILDCSLSKLMLLGPKEELMLTYNAQPAILTNSIALWREMSKMNFPKGSFVAGHSLGEYSALVASEVISFEEAVKLVYFRGKYMEEAVSDGVGSMAAVLGMDKDLLSELCKDITRESHTVEIANYNTSNQIVVSGHKLAVKELSDLALKNGAKRVVDLPVSGPFHSSLMKVVGDRLESHLNNIEFKSFTVPIIANVKAVPLHNSSEIADSLLQQVSQPVLWEQSITYLLKQGVTHFIEIGHGGVLTTMMKKIDRNVKSIYISNMDNMQEALSILEDQNV